MKAALIVGNNDYSFLDKLCLCVRDAELINQTMINLGFRTKLCTNCTNEQLRDELMKFGDQLEENDIAFFYFGGHAGQQNVGNKHDNYLFGIDACPKQIGDANTLSGIPVNKKILESWFREECIYLIVLDSCREYPAKNLKYKSASCQQIAEVKRTLAPAFLPEHIGAGQFDVVYACQPGRVAIENENLKNGYLASALSASLQSAGNWNSALTEMMNKVHIATEGRQNPSVLHNVRVQLDLVQKKEKPTIFFEVGRTSTTPRTNQGLRSNERQTMRYIINSKDSGDIIRIVVYRGDITKWQGDAIVNATDEYMSGGGGVDGAIHYHAGTELMKAIWKLPEVGGKQIRCPTGEAVVTDAFNLPCKYIIHTAGPIFKLKPEDEALQKLRMCYINCLNRAQEKEVKKIAFPAISCGLFGAPAEKAAQTAIFSVQEYLKTYKSCIQEVWFVLLEYSLFDVYKELADENFELEEED